MKKICKIFWIYGGFFFKYIPVTNFQRKTRAKKKKYRTIPIHSQSIFMLESSVKCILEKHRAALMSFEIIVIPSPYRKNSSKIMTYRDVKLSRKSNTRLAHINVAKANRGSVNTFFFFFLRANPMRDK